MAAPPVSVPVVDPTSAEYLHSQRKCKRCERLYTLADEDQTCAYHPGDWVDPAHTREGAMIGWSCCRIAGFMPLNAIVKAQFGGAIQEFSIPNEAAFERNCRGCKTAPEHEEDERYRAAISTFPYDATAKPLVAPPEVAAPPTLDAPKDDKTKEPEPETDGLLRHPVTRGDTLVGLSLKYGVPVHVIKSVNKIPPYVNECYQFKVLLIPTDVAEPIVTPANESSKTVARRMFKNATKCTAAEAKYYMDEHGDDLAAALKQWREDEEFEQQNSSNEPRAVQVKSVKVLSTVPKKRRGLFGRLCPNFLKPSKSKNKDTKNKDNKTKNSKSSQKDSKAKTNKDNASGQLTKTGDSAQANNDEFELGRVSRESDSLLAV
eukprot:TRINITY_DN11699_c0_g1_i1.p1 TRINITY_DN11699_c0_g1~~TRINITY_DN11699_c0_g1_i1.p1  ORF type:complete len:407 (-),score=148.80 TRINITY_DN11699_c0_g1_i1:220-1344(-)